MPYMVDVQSDLLSALRIWLVMRLTRFAVAVDSAPRRLALLFEIERERLALQPRTATGVDSQLLRKPVVSPAAKANLY
jgi:hypothetical protein